MTDLLNIFVIDDSEDDRLLYRRALQKNIEQQYNIAEADNGEDGLGRLETEQPACVLLDYSMPGHSGVEVLKRIREKYPFVAVVMLTGQGDTMVAVNAMKEGAQDYLPKDSITSEVLQKSVQNAIEKVELLKQLHTQNEELKLTNMRLQEANAASQVAAKAKNDFLANMSHELRTPMNSVLGMSELLLTTELNEKQVKFANAIYNSGNMMLDLVSDILDFSKIEAGELRLHNDNISLYDAIKDIIELVENSAAKRNITLKIDYDETIPGSISIDKLRLRQIIINMVNNAIKFTEDGNVTISVKQLNKTENQCSLRFEITDNGIGIEKDKQAYIFEKFTQIDSSSTRQYGGTGLGLSICKDLIDLMGGTIGVISEPGKGSTFWFEITAPISTNQQQNLAKAINDNSNDKLPFAVNLLVAEDNSDNRFVIREMLEYLGCNVSIYNNGRETLSELEANHSKYDMIIMDCQMPEMDGYEVTKHIRNHPWGKDIPIIAVTAHALYGDQKKCLDAGMSDYISKPLRMADIKDVIDKYSKKAN